MTDAHAARRIWSPTIRTRLGIALALALLPVLVLSGVQAALAFASQAAAKRADLMVAAQRSAALTEARVESARALLETVLPDSLGPGCAGRLAATAVRLKGYENLIRFDAQGAVMCASATVPAASWAERSWFRSLIANAPVAVEVERTPIFGGQPSLIVAVPAPAAAGRFSGVFAAAISLESLRPQTFDPTLPVGWQTAIADARGRWLSSTDPSQFPREASIAFAPKAAAVFQRPDAAGQPRLFAAAPASGAGLFVAVSAPEEGLASWVWLNPVTSVALPVLEFTLALAAVWVVADRGVARWITYLQRIAAIYARGRFSVRPVRAERAPPEIRDLADALGAMAQTIDARDATLNEHLAQKDAMLLEIHHRVKNNLQVISSLLSMQQRALTDPAARAAIYETRQRISALALIYRALYQSPDLRRVDLREFLAELVGQLVTGEGEAKLIIRTELACDPLMVDPDRLAPIALFAVEAISNACKHGLSEGGRLSVSLHADADLARLTISDSGLPGCAPRLGVGVGRTLMTAYARQLRAEASFTPNATGGLTASLAFPIAESVEPDPAAREPQAPPQPRRAGTRR